MQKKILLLGYLNMENRICFLLVYKVQYYHVCPIVLNWQSTIHQMYKLYSMRIHSLEDAFIYFKKMLFVKSLEIT